MKLDETTLIEIQDYINALDEKVGLKSETVEDIRNAINKHKSELKNLRLVAVSGAERKVCEQHQYEYYGFPISSKRCKVCGYEKM